VRQPSRSLSAEVPVKMTTDRVREMSNGSNQFAAARVQVRRDQRTQIPTTAPARHDRHDKLKRRTPPS
jgi:hypothetical protein